MHIQPAQANIPFRQTRAAVLLAACLSLAAPAVAQDPWSGGYVGVAATSSRNVISGTTVKADGTVGANATNEAANALTDAAGGFALQAGLRKRLGSGLIVGLHADIARPGHQTRTQNLIDGGVYAGQPSATLQYETPWLATARAVAAWSFGDLLVFGSGGAAFAAEQVTRTQYRAVPASSVTAAQFSETDRQLRRGYVLGAGLEWRWSSRWALRAEYLQARFPDQAFNFPDARGGAQGAFATVQGRAASNHAHLSAVWIGLSYAFGRGH